MAFEPNWNDSVPVRWDITLQSTRQSLFPWGVSNIARALWSWLGSVAVYRNITTIVCPSSSQHMCIVSFVSFYVEVDYFFHPVRPLSPPLLSFTLSVILLFCVAVMLSSVSVFKSSVESNPSSTAYNPPCHQPFLSCHLLGSPAGWPAVAFYSHTLSLFPYVWTFSFAVYHVSPPHCTIFSCKAF